MSVRSLPPSELLEVARGGDRRPVGRLLTLVERGGEVADSIATMAQPHSTGAHVVGITGAPGAGKSTLVSKLVGLLVERGTKPAVLAVDPSSPLTGGAILGDRVRMADVDEVAFIRSVATRGHAGGLALSIPGAARVLDAVGFSPVVIETVGVGQVEVDVTAAADTTVVVVTPGMGDAVQANKAGLLEVADIFVVNKADRPGAADARRDLELMLELSHVTGQEDAAYRPPILMADSIGGDGVAEVVDAIEAHREHLEASGGGAIRRARRVDFELRSRLAMTFEVTVAELMDSPETETLVQSVVNGKTSVVEAVEHLRGKLLAR